jgi:uncharacterized membrane protein
MVGASGPGFEATEPIAFGWNAVMKNFGGIAVPIVVAGLVSAVPNFILSVMRGFVVGMLTASNTVDSTALMAINGGSFAVTYLISLIVQAYMIAGMVQFSLRVCRGERPDFGVVFSGGPHFLAMLGGSLLHSLGAGLGLAFCIVPGLFLAGSWVAYSAFIVDKNMGPIAALSASWQAMAPYRVTGLVYVLLTGVVVIAGLCACLIGALLVSLPVIMIGNAYLYLKLIGEQPRLATA